MTTPTENVLNSLDNVRSSSNGWTARCAAHVDTHNSLSIREGDDGRVLVHCFVGCNVRDIMTAIGLELKDLFPKQ